MINFSTYRYCRHTPTQVKCIDDIHYMGASQSCALEFDGDLMINFTRTPDIPSVMAIPELAEYVGIRFKEIMVPWPDLGTPHIDPGFWRALHEYIDKNNFKEVCFHCEAGHGRTGTALCAMLIANDGFSAHEAVEHVRSMYCDEAVETWEQATYLQELDEYYNDREIEREDCPIPSAVIANKRREEEERKNKSEKFSKGVYLRHWSG